MHFEWVVYLLIPGAICGIVACLLAIGWVIHGEAHDGVDSVRVDQPRKPIDERRHRNTPPPRYHRRK